MNIQPYNPNVQGGQFCIISGEPSDVYHANPAISNTDLSMFLSDPKRFEALRKGEVEPKQTQSLHFGDVFHTRCLESVKVFQSRFVLEKDCPQVPTAAQYRAHADYICNFKPSASIGESESLKKPTKAQVEAQEKRDKLIREHNNFWNANEGKKVVSNDDMSRANKMRNAIFSDPDAAPLLEGFDNMHKELTIRTEELDYGFSVQSKLDLYDEKNNVAIDLKTVANLDIFKRNFVKFGYYRQAAFYMLVAELEFGRKVDHLYFIAVESEAPHEVAVFEASPHAVYQGNREIKAGLNALGYALRSDSYSKRYPGIQELDLNEWDDDKIEKRLERIESELAA